MIGALCCLIALTAPSVVPARMLSSRRLLLRGSGIEADGEVSRLASSMETCAALNNYGSHFAVDVDVGTPPQRFSLVADTGSNSLIVTSCVCVDVGMCPLDDKCFRGTNRSSTFVVS